jgi:death-on-curing protein
VTRYLSADQIYFIHARAIEKFGGFHGTRDCGLVESAAARPGMTFLGQDLYQGITVKAAVLCHSLCINHPFIDGNKRTAFACMDIFLQMNGLIITADDDEAEETMLKLISGKIDEKGLSNWLASNTAELDEH